MSAERIPYSSTTVLGIGADNAVVVDCAACCLTPVLAPVASAFLLSDSEHIGRGGGQLLADSRQCVGRTEFVMGAVLSVTLHVDFVCCPIAL
jgi:hypothetical protein